MAVFRDFNFKLLVIEKLMYWDRTLTPVFSIEERMEDRGITDLQSHVFDNDLAFTVLDESRTFFGELEISQELLASVDTLVVDGGHQVYYECSPVWDGEDDLFDVHSLDDLASRHRVLPRPDEPAPGRGAPGLPGGGRSGR
jgi:hypothetical protein